jgi:uncharacterized protein with PIN domain
MDDAHAAGAVPRFLADAMLGRLARWLRLLGYDTVYDPGQDRELLERAWREGRLFLTRDTRLLRRRRLPPHLFIRSDQVSDQVREVLSALGLPRAARAPRRCLRCNALLEPRRKDEVAGLVPEFVWSEHQDFWGCPDCARIYWPGTHRQRMEEAIRALGEGGAFDGSSVR